MSLVVATRSAARDERYWVPHPKFAWLPRTVERKRETTVTFKNEDPQDGDLTFPTDKLYEFAVVLPEQEEGVEDVCTLPSVNDGALLHTVRVRYFKDVIYTRVARTIIAVNPFKNLPLYSQAYVDKYLQVTDSLDLPPHIYGICQDALRGLRSSGNDQAVLISGESGAGKTESAKLILSFVTEASRSSEGWLEEQVIQTNQVLESYGNAMTVKNNNSSRFGKWLDLRFTRGSLELLGCGMTSYLLETTRVCSVAPKERGFHIFFQLIKARNSEALQPLNIREVKEYRFLKGGELVAGDISDVKCFEELCESLTALRFSEEQKVELFKLTMGVLTLGNCEFKDGPVPDSSVLADRAPLEEAARLLAIPAEALEGCILRRKIVVGPETTQANNKPEEAAAARDSIARFYYGRIFSWLIGCMNRTLTLSKAFEKDCGVQLFGVLDIAGFEDFKHNSLEQLLINLSNEHLQAFFNKVVFKEELAESVEENIRLPDDVTFSDNAEVVALIDGKGGLCHLLDETMAIARNTNESYVSKVSKELARHPSLVVSKIAQLGFGVRHFAGEVHYNCQGWLEKNGNKAPDEARQCLGKSSSWIWKEIAEELLGEEEASPRRVGSKQHSTSVASSFRASLQSLMKQIDTRDPHFIRCIKPNIDKVPDKLDSLMVTQQLLFSGVLATVRIRQQGYAYRMPHEEFCMTYRAVLQRPGRQAPASSFEVSAGARASASEALALYGRGDMDHRRQAELAIDAMPEYVKWALGPRSDIDEDQFALGKSKVFIKAQAFRELERARRAVLHGVVKQIQRIIRGRRERRELVDKRTTWLHIKRLLAQNHLAVASGAVGLDAERPAGRRRCASAWYGESALSHLGSKEALKAVVDELAPLMERAKEQGLANGDMVAAARAIRRMNMEIGALAEVEELLAADAPDLLSAEKAVARAAALGVTEDIPAVAQLQSRVDELREQARRADEARDAEAAAEAPAAEAAEAAEPKAARAKSEKKRVSIAAPKEQEEEDDDDDDDDGLPAQVHIKSVQSDWLADSCSMGRARSERQLETEAVLEGLATARREYDVEALESLLRRARALPGLGAGAVGAARAAPAFEDDTHSEPDCDRLEGESEVAAATRVLLRLQDVDFALEVLERAQLAAGDDDPSPVVLRRLENLTALLKTRPGFEEEAMTARKSLATGLAKRMSIHGGLNRGRRRSSAAGLLTAGLGADAVDDADDDEAQDPEEEALEERMAEMAFGDVTAFCDLKPGWRNRGGDVEEAFQFSKVGIDAALTKWPKGSGTREDLYEAMARQNFQNILVCMDDKPRFNIQKSAAREAVLDLAIAHPVMLAEVYMQVIKQLTRNPRRSSNRLGWELLLALLMHAPPDGEVAECLRAFLTRGEGRPSKLSFSGCGVVSLARACIAELNARYGFDAEEVLTDDEDGDEAARLGVAPAVRERVRDDLDVGLVVRGRHKEGKAPSRTEATRNARAAVRSPWLQEERPQDATPGNTRSANIAEFVAGKEVDKIGLALPYVPMKPLVVRKVAPRTWAYRQGFQVGDVVTCLNDQSIMDMSEEDFQVAMRRRPLKFTVDMDQFEQLERAGWVMPKLKKDAGPFSPDARSPSGWYNRTAPQTRSGAGARPCR